MDLLLDSDSTYFVLQSSPHKLSDRCVFSGDFMKLSEGNGTISVLSTKSELFMMPVNHDKLIGAKELPWEFHWGIQRKLLRGTFIIDWISSRQIEMARSHEPLISANAFAISFRYALRGQRKPTSNQLRALHKCVPQTWTKNTKTNFFLLPDSQRINLISKWSVSRYIHDTSRNRIGGGRRVERKKVLIANIERSIM